jgi:hypothetical protein
LLVSITIIAVLIGLVVVGLGRARGSGVRMQCVNNARSCAQAMMVYAGDFADAYPNSADFSDGAAFHNGGFLLPYWTLSGNWTHPMLGYLGEGRIVPQQVCPASHIAKMFKRGTIGEFLDMYPPGYVPPSEYWMSYAMLSGPRMWADPPPPFNLSYLRVVRHAEVAHPSNKGLLIEVIPRHLLGEEQYGMPVTAVWTPAGASLPTTVVFADGAARSLAPNDMNPPQSPDLTTPFLFIAPVLATRDGVLGVDHPR